MTPMTADRARELLGARLNGHDVLVGHANRDGVTLLTRERRGWPWWQREPQEREPREKRPGMRLIGTGAVLLVLLGVGLLAVSYAAQYRYVLAERHHEVTASLIEAGALDVGMVIFSLIALGLALAGLASKTERAAIIACAAASAVMNFAPADAASWRSVLAWTMPPIFLAFVVDRVVSAVRRHVLGLREGRSPWAAISDATARVLRLAGLAALYSLRFLLAAPSTCSGLRRAILAATPLPTAPVPAEAGEDEDDRPRCQHVVLTSANGVAVITCGKPLPCRDHPRRRLERAAGSGTKTARLLDLVKERHGELAAIPLAEVSKIATAIAPEAGLHPASARTALLGAVRAALPAGE